MHTALLRVWSNTYCLVIFTCWSIAFSSCSNQIDDSGYNLAVVNGAIPVTEPSQAPGTYKIQYIYDGRPFGAGGTISAIGPDRFLTNGHVAIAGKDEALAGAGIDLQAMNIRISDYQDQTVYEGRYRDVKVVNHPDWNPGIANELKDAQFDVSGMILPHSVEERLSQGWLSIADAPLDDGEKANIAGAGVGFANYKDQEGIQRIYADLKAGREVTNIPSPDFPLTVAENSLRRNPSEGLYHAFGPSPNTPDSKEGLTVPGDSGGTVFANRDGVNQLFAINQSGGFADYGAIPDALKQGNGQTEFDRMMREEFKPSLSPGEIAEFNRKIDDLESKSRNASTFVDVSLQGSNGEFIKSIQNATYSE